MKRYGLALTLIVLAYSMFCRADDATTKPSARPLNIDLDAGMVREYRGDINGKRLIGMSLRISSDGKSATGCYFYYQYCKDIRIDARIDGRTILIREYDAHGNQTGRFMGGFPTTDPRHHYQTGDDLQTEVIVGYWSLPDGSKRRPFYLNLASSGFWPEAGSRYADAGFDNEQEVNDFVSRFRQAVLDGQVDRVTGMVRFPINASVDGKLVAINDPQDFYGKYDKIFSSAFVERIRRSPPCHMFSRDEGVMLGDGQVWVGPVQHDGKRVPIVIAINNKRDANN